MGINKLSFLGTDCSDPCEEIDCEEEECEPGGFCNSVLGTLSSSDEFQVVITGAVDQTVPAEVSETGNECVLPMSEINGTWVLSYVSSCVWSYSDSPRSISISFIELFGDYYLQFTHLGFGEDTECYISSTTGDDCAHNGILIPLETVLCEEVEVIDFDSGPWEFDSEAGYHFGEGNTCQTIHVVVSKL